MCLRRVAERQNPVDSRGNRSFLQHIEDRLSPRQQGVAGQHIVLQVGPADRQRTEPVKPLQVEGRDGAARHAEQHQRPARSHQPERLFEDRHSDIVECGMETRESRDRADHFRPIVRAVGDRVIGANLSGTGQLGGGGGSGDDRGAEALGHLHHKPARSAGGGMDQHPIAGRDGVGVMGHIMRGHAMGQTGSGGIQGNPFGYRHQAGRGNDGIFRIGTEDAAVGDAVADSEASGIGAYGRDLASGFVTGGIGQGGLVLGAAALGAALALADISVIDPRECLPHQDHAPARLRNRHVFQCHNLGPAERVHANGLHRIFSLSMMGCAMGIGIGRILADAVPMH